MQKIDFTANLEKESAIFFITEAAKGAVLDFSQRYVKKF